MKPMSYRVLSPAIYAALLTLGTVGGATAQQRPQLVSAAEPQQAVAFDIYLPLQNTDKLDELLAAQHTQGSPAYHQWLTPQEFQTRFGPNPAQFEKIAAGLRSQGFTVTATTSRSLHVEGTTALVKSAFHADLWNAGTSAFKDRLVSPTPLALSPALTEAGAHIMGFAPQAQHHTFARTLGAVPENRYSADGPYWFDDLKQAYYFPSYKALTGHGRTIAVVIDSDVYDSDLSTFFGHEGLVPPLVIRVPVLGGPGAIDPSSSSALEAAVDSQQSGGMAPGATIALYMPPDLTDNSVLAAYQTIIDDNKADIVSSSFGLPELYYTAAYNGGVDYTYILRLFEEVFKQGNAQGITFVVASGDSGGLGALDPTGTYMVAGINHPADDPHVTAVGGTNLVTTYTSGSLESKYVSENAYFDALDPTQTGIPNLNFAGGGGKSVIFGKPLYQELVHTGSSTRSIPDMSLHMGGCPLIALMPCGPDRSASVVALDGAFYGVIGTSLSAPDLAGLLALEEEHLHTRLGNVNYEVYGLSALQHAGFYYSFHQNIPGNNGLYTSPASKNGGYNLVLGNGTPIGVNFILAPFTPVAGTPQTPTNP